MAYRRIGLGDDSSIPVPSSVSDWWNGADSFTKIAVVFGGFFAIFAVFPKLIVPREYRSKR